MAASRAARVLISPEVLGTGAGIAIKAIGTRLAFGAARGVFGEAGVVVTGAQLRNRALFDGALVLLGLAGTLAFRGAWLRQVAVGVLATSVVHGADRVAQLAGARPQL